MVKGLDSSNGMTLQGFVDIVIEDKVTGMRRKQQMNTVTDLGKLLFLGMSANELLNRATQISRGTLYITSPALSSSTFDIKSSIGVSLLNTEESFVKDRRTMPVLTKGMIDKTKVTGYAGVRRTPINAKEGVVHLTANQHMVDSTAVGQTWMFTEQQGNGVFNKITIGALPYENEKNGFLIAKGILPNDVTEQGGVKYLSNNYIRPNVPNLTSSSEILVSTLQNGTTANAVYNLETGVLVQIGAEDSRYGVLLGDVEMQQYVYGNCLYMFREQYVYEYDTVTKVSKRIGSSVSYVSEMKMFIKGTKLVYGKYAHNLYEYDLINRVELGTTTDLKTQSKTSTIYKGTLTDYNFLESARIINDADNNFLIIVPNGVTNGLGVSLRCSDITNIENTIIEILPSSVNFCNEYKVGTKCISFLGSIISTINQQRVITGVSSTDEGRNNYGLKYTERWYGNLISYVELTSPITKSDTEVMYVSYGYRMV